MSKVRALIWGQDEPLNQREEPGNPMLRFIRLAIMGAAFLALLVGVNYAKLPLKNADNTDVVKNKEYRSTGDSYFISYPNEWSRAPREDLARYGGAFSFMIKRAEPGALLGVRVQELKAAKVDLLAIARSLDRTMGRKFAGFEKLSEKRVSLRGGHEGLVYDYLFLADGELLVHERLLIVPTEKRVYWMTAWSNADDFAAIAPDLETILASFRPSEKGGKL